MTKKTAAQYNMVSKRAARSVPLPNRGKQRWFRSSEASSGAAFHETLALLAGTRRASTFPIMNTPPSPTEPKHNQPQQPPPDPDPKQHPVQPIHPPIPVQPIHEGTDPKKPVIEPKV